MRLEHLVADKRVIAMSYGKLLEQIRDIREARVNYTPTPTKKKKAKSQRRRKSDIEKLFDKMSDEEKQALIAELTKED